uniref:HD-GYP domain-containing protein n=2 Tax=Kuenenia stuttgartiensis TaxID=174633 RepID=Q1Q4W3_KUEST|nr:unknown protein [Candidatus Kuenenia stuttgartiensis]
MPNLTLVISFRNMGYKEPLSHEETVKRIESDSGEHFDPDIVDAFLEIEKEFKGISVSENINIKVPKGFK